MSIQRSIWNRIKSLEEMDNVNVDESDGHGVISITHKLHHVAEFDFKWVDDSHYVGYFVDASGNASQAVVSIWTKLDAIKFCSLYVSLVELRAKRES